MNTCRITAWKSTSNIITQTERMCRICLMSNVLQSEFLRFSSSNEEQNSKVAFGEMKWYNFVSKSRYLFWRCINNEVGLQRLRIRL